VEWWLLGVGVGNLWTCSIGFEFQLCKMITLWKLIR
jgi:hypothetical protein